MSYLKKTVANGLKEKMHEEIFRWFFRYGSQFNQTEEVYLTILNCLDVQKPKKATLRKSLRMSICMAKKSLLECHPKMDG